MNRTARCSTVSRNEVERFLRWLKRFRHIATIAGDSELGVPEGFSITLPFTHERTIDLLMNDPGTPPDIPEFAMSGGVAAAGEMQTVSILVYSDGVSNESQPAQVLTSWFESIAGADFAEPSLLDQDNLILAMSKGTAQALGADAPQGIIAVVIYEPQTRRAWRLACAVSSNEVSEEVERACEHVQDEFRPAGPPGEERS